MWFKSLTILVLLSKYLFYSFGLNCCKKFSAAGSDTACDHTLASLAEADVENNKRMDLEKEEKKKKF